MSEIIIQGTGLAKTYQEGPLTTPVFSGIDVQVLSLTAPGVEQLDATEAVALAREANDRLADAVRRHQAGSPPSPRCRPRRRKRRPMSWSVRSANTASRAP